MVSRSNLAFVAGVELAFQVAIVFVRKVARCLVFDYGLFSRLVSLSILAFHIFDNCLRAFHLFSFCSKAFRVGRN